MLSVSNVINEAREGGHERQIKLAKCPINRIKLLDIQMNLIKLAQKQKIDGMNRVEFVKYIIIIQYTAVLL